MVPQTTKVLGFDFRIREYDPTIDENFVMHSWKHSLRHMYRWVPRKIYFGEMDAFLRKAVPNCRIAVACSTDDNDQLFGWGAVMGDTLVYLFVKSAYRRLRVATELLSELGAPVTAAMWTRSASLFRPRLDHDPSILTKYFSDGDEDDPED